MAPGPPGDPGDPSRPFGPGPPGPPVAPGDWITCGVNINYKYNTMYYDVIQYNIILNRVVQCRVYIISPSGSIQFACSTKQYIFNI